jgi:hypothetical protein
MPISAAPSEQHRIGGGVGQQPEAQHGRAHADGQRLGHRMAIGGDADDRLEQRGGALEDEGEQADLPELQGEILGEDRIDRRQQRLHDVVEQMAEADGEDDGVGRRAGGGGGPRPSAAARMW